MEIFAKIKEILINFNIIKSTFVGEMFIYVDKHGNPTDIEDGVMIKFLKPIISVKCYKKDADKLLFQKAHELYPQYKGYINIFWYDT